MAPRLRVSAGPSVEKLALVRVNDENSPFEINTDSFQGRVTVRIKDFTGIRPKKDADLIYAKDADSAKEDKLEQASKIDTTYFDHGHAKGCTWSIQIQGRFKEDNGVCIDDVEYGNKFEHPIRDKLPWGTSVALRAIGILDPTLHHDVYCDEPWAFGPLVTSLTRVNVKRVDKASADDMSKWPAFPKGNEDADYVQDDTAQILASDDKAETVREELEEQGLADLNTLSQLRDAQSGHTNRARIFGNQAIRQATQFNSNDIVTLAFDNAFIDFNTLRLVLPYTGGMSFDLQRYWDGQPVRYFCRNASTGAIYFVVEFQIVEKD